MFWQTNSFVSELAIFISFFFFAVLNLISSEKKTASGYSLCLPCQIAVNAHHCLKLYHQNYKTTSWTKGKNKESQKTLCLLLRVKYLDWESKSVPLDAKKLQVCSVLLFILFL